MTDSAAPSDTPSTNQNTELLGFDNTPPEQTLSRYFATLNAEDFQKTAELFAKDGALNPPFESPIVGQEAIVAYLNKEAKGLQLFPLRKAVELLELGEICYRVIGKVQTALFTVNVEWIFTLTESAEICSVEVKLLAAMKELLKLKR